MRRRTAWLLLPLVVLVLWRLSSRPGPRWQAAIDASRAAEGPRPADVAPPVRLVPSPPREHSPREVVVVELRPDAVRRRLSEPWTLPVPAPVEVWPAPGEAPLPDLATTEAVHEVYEVLAHLPPHGTVPGELFEEVAEAGALDGFFDADATPEALAEDPWVGLVGAAAMGARVLLAAEDEGDWEAEAHRYVARLEAIVTEHPTSPASDFARLHLLEPILHGAVSVDLAGAEGLRELARQTGDVRVLDAAVRSVFDGFGGPHPDEAAWAVLDEVFDDLSEPVRAEVARRALADAVGGVVPAEALPRWLARTDRFDPDVAAAEALLGAPRTWRATLQRAARTCDLPPQAGDVLEGQWIGRRWRWERDLPWTTCVERPDGPVPEEAVQVRLEVVDMR